MELLLYSHLQMYVCGVKYVFPVGGSQGSPNGIGQSEPHVLLMPFIIQLTLGEPRGVAVLCCLSSG